MLAPGTVIGEKYRVERVIGRGGMGTVVEVTHAQLGTAFALKFLHHTVSAAMPERFLREARATSAFKSEHVCRVFDFGAHQGQPYLVMERLEGTDLSKLLRRVGRFPPHDVCDYLIQACAGIAEAHAAQIVHRDLKPGNLFLTSRPDGTPLIKVLDFGIAKAPQDTEHDLTGTHAILGSPSYMSLEQLRSSKLVDTRSDIWSLGVILYELISGRRPFVGDGVADLAVKIALEPTPPLPEGPRELDEVIARCLAREPAQRYQTVGELAFALAPFASDAERSLALGLARVSSTGGFVRPSGSALAPPVPPSGQHSEVSYGPATTMLSAGAIEERPRPPRASRARLGLIGAVAVAIIAAASIGIAVSGRDAGGPRAAGPGDPSSDPEGSAGSAAAAAAPEETAPAPPVEQAAPAPTPPVQPTLPAAPAAPADAAIDEPEDPAASPGTDPAVAKKPPAKAPPPPPRRPPPRRPPPPAPPPGDEDLGKSRI